MESEDHRGSWIHDDPDMDPSSVRFGAGSLVMFKRENGWFDGEVIKVCQMLVVPPEFNPERRPPMKILYLVWPHVEDPDGSEMVQEDSEDFIRPRLEDLSPNPTTFHPKLVAPTDPFAYLYTGVTHDPYLEDGSKMADGYQNLDIVNEAKTNPDGSTRIKFRHAREEVTTGIVNIPQEPIHGVPGDAIIQLAQNLSRRRPWTQGTFDPVAMLETIVPAENSLQELEEASRLSDEKMLLLGDALMTGVRGWPRDPMRASVCYKAAAWGCQEFEQCERIGIPVGSPEAMMQSAYICLVYIKRQLMGLDLWDNVSSTELVRHTLQLGRTSILHQIFCFVSAALRRGFVSPTAYDLAFAIQDNNLMSNAQINDDTKRFMQPILDAYSWREVEIKFEKLQKQGAIPRGQTHDSTIDHFSKRSKEIYLNLPVSAGAIHIEYREIPRVPFPIVVYAIRADRKELVKAVELPGNIQISPFSEESFRFVWLRIAFDLHLGRVGTEERTRPTEFTVLDTHGNREFASYLRNELDGSGTTVRLVSDSEPVGRGRRKNQKKRLGDIVRQIEHRLLEIPGFLIDNKSAFDGVISSAQQAFIRQYARDTFTQVGNDERQIRQNAEQLKTQGNNLFASSDHSGANRCYSIAIQLLRLLIEHNNDSYLLLGTLLSNRAATFLEMEGQRSSPEFQKLLTQNAIRDCTVALESSWSSTVLPQRINDKLKFRRDKAIARFDVLQCEFQSEIRSFLFPETSSDIRRQRREEDDMIRAHNDTAARPASASDEPPAKPTTTDHIEFESLMERGQTIYDSSLAKNCEDGCPICLRKFNGELSHTHSVVLSCGEHALCVECVCSLKKESDKSDQKLTCPMCRASVDGQVVENLAFRIIEVDKELAAAIEKFPANFDESVSVAQQLLWKQNFKVNAVVDALEDIIDDRARGIFFRTESDLNHKQKDSIYREARLPIDRLKNK